MYKKRLNLRNAAAIFACLVVVVGFVSCKKDDAKQITAFSFVSPQATGVINESAKTIVVDVPAGTAVTALVPTIKVSEKATVSPLSGVVQDFTNPVKYTVTAEDGSTASYTVTVTINNGDNKKNVLINGVRWAICNVDKPGTFTQNSEDAGMFYQWNSKIGWSVADPVKDSDGGMAWGYYFIKGNKWAKANDPSPTGYRVPTIEEIDKLLDEKLVTRTWVTQNGVEGMKFTDKSTENAIFIPAVGRRDLKGKLEYVGIGGCYWSSTTNFEVFARCLEFISSSAGTMGHEFGYGNSVRPVVE